ncbi:MAG: hypothetical protein OXF43_11025 [Gammaproteobacteria bacterium]|nr:hypothetical protein [Gammaproteobacteria bacterium]
MAGKTRAEAGIQRLNGQPDKDNESGANFARERPATYTKHPNGKVAEITQVLTGKKNHDGTVELRRDSVARDKPEPGKSRGIVNIQKTQAKARKMINTGKGGIRVPTGKQREPRKTAKERAEEQGQLMLKLSGLEDHGSAIKMNLLSKSGLSENRVMRDLNILESSVGEAAHHLRADGLLPALNAHFQLDRLKETDKKQADGCTIAALLLMNAAMLHQRISNGGWLSGISDLALIKNEADVVRKMAREWERIMRHDFRPVLEPALEAIYAVETTGKTAGLERALHHLAAEAERIAETYADMGADHAGPLFNRVMGNQASDGAFFTRPVAASLAARLTLDACGGQDWSDPEVWRRHKTVDLACGSGTLLAAMLTDMKRRASEQGANTEKLAELQKLAVEDVIKGLDINPVSLQLAASQLTAGNQRVSYRRMGLHLMPYGPDKHAPDQVHAGTLELLGQRAVVQRPNELDLDDDAIDSQATWEATDDAELEDAVDAVKDTRIVIMNPPFTNRANMGEKFPQETQKTLRTRADGLEEKLTQADPGLEGFADKNSIGPLFVGLADHCVERSDGVLTMINPTIALTTPSGQRERLALAQRFHIHTVLTSHQPGNINLSQHTAINESIVVMRRHDGDKPPTRFINLDRFPADDGEAADFHQCLENCEQGLMANGWGEVSHWPAEHIEAGDWTPAIWRSPALAKAAWEFANHPNLQPLGSIPDCIAHDGSRRVRENFEKSNQDNEESIPILESKGAEGQKTIQSTPDGYWVFKKGRERQARHYLEWSSHLLITAGQDNSTARLTATASESKYLGQTWFSVVGLSPAEAKAIAVFANSTPGRLQIMRDPGKKLEFPSYAPRATNNLSVPDIQDERICRTLADCWERTKDMLVPQYRDGECEVRRLWDEAVAEAMGWDPAELTRLRLLLHKEPHVRGLGYGQYADEVEIAPAARQRFTELADRWEKETWFLSSSSRAVEHPAHKEIVSMGEPVVPLILERMRGERGHWYFALRAITGANPVNAADRGKVAVMEQAWLRWGEINGYV